MMTCCNSTLARAAGRGSARYYLTLTLADGSERRYVVLARDARRAAYHARNLYLASCADIADLFDDCEYWIGAWGYQRRADGLFAGVI
jgi:hypothetical protein